VKHICASTFAKWASNGLPDTTDSLQNRQRRADKRTESHCLLNLCAFLPKKILSWLIDGSHQRGFSTHHCTERDGFCGLRDTAAFGQPRQRPCGRVCGFPSSDSASNKLSGIKAKVLICTHRMSQLPIVAIKSCANGFDFLATTPYACCGQLGRADASVGKTFGDGSRNYKRCGKNLSQPRKDVA
jgi:hypothetical protein